MNNINFHSDLLFVKKINPFENIVKLEKEIKNFHRGVNKDYVYDGTVEII